MKKPNGNKEQQQALVADMLARGNEMKKKDKRLHSRGASSLASECKRRRVAYAETRDKVAHVKYKV